MTKQDVKAAIANFVLRLSRSRAGSFVFELIINAAMNQQRVVRYGPHRITFIVPNRLTNFRVETFATKEPDTLTWIESMPEDSVLWDVGANVGLYSIYAARARNCRVYAFEPSVFNLELLARNIHLNGLQDRVTIIPVALTDRIGPNSFKMTTTTWGGALSTFGENYDQHGARLKEVFEYQSFGMRVADAVSLMQIAPPDYLKIDVDGIEHLILRGATDTLSTVKGVLIEIDDSFREQSDESIRLLEKAGLVLQRKCDLGVPTMFNQWWSRPSVPRGGRMAPFTR